KPAGFLRRSFWLPYDSPFDLLYFRPNSGVGCGGAMRSAVTPRAAEVASPPRPACPEDTASRKASPARHRPSSAPRLGDRPLTGPCPMQADREGKTRAGEQPRASTPRFATPRLED